MTPTDPDSRPAAAAGLWRTTAWIVVFKILANAAVAGVVLVTARRLGPTGRGVFVLLLTLATFTVMVCGVGMNMSGRIHLVGENCVESGAFLGLATVLTLAQTVVCAAVGIVLLPLVHVHLSAAEYVMLGVLAGSLLAPFLLGVAVNAYGMTTAAAALDAAGNVVQLGLVVVLAVGGAHRVDPYAYAVIVSNVVQIALSLGILRRAGVPIRPAYRADQWRVLVRTGVTGIPMDVSQGLTFRVDRYILGLFLTPAAVGVYSVAATAPELLRLPSLALSQPIIHRLASGAAKAEDFARTRALALALTAAMAVVTVLFAPWGVRVFFGADYAGAVTPLRILLLAEFGITLFYIDGSVLAAGMRRLGDASRAAFCGLVVVAIGDFALIPSFGLAGAAWASVAAYSVVGIVSHILLKRALHDAVLT